MFKNRGIRISKRIEVKSRDNSTEGYIPRSQAIKEVREFLSDWDSDEQNFLVRRRDPKIMYGGKLNEWRPIQSGPDGPLVLQLV